MATKKSKGLYGVDTKPDQVRALKREKSIKAQNEKAGVRPVGGAAKPSRLPETSKVPSVGLSRTIQTHGREAMPTSSAGRKAPKAVKVAPEGGRFKLKAATKVSRLAGAAVKGQGQLGRKHDSGAASRASKVGGVAKK
jgi:hypothetical protein